jgi:hypothetical protein
MTLTVGASSISSTTRTMPALPACEIRRLTARPAHAKPVAPVFYDLVQGAGMQQNCAAAVTNSA